MGGFVVRCAAEVLRRLWIVRVKAALVAACSGLTLFSCSSAGAQDDFFKPVFEATATPKPLEASGPIYSFARMEPAFKGLCTGLEADGRRERLVSIAEAGVAREKVCITCRSFWKMIVSACGKLGPRPTPTPKPPRKKKGKEGEVSVEGASPEKGEVVERTDDADAAASAEDVPASPTVAVTTAAGPSRRPARYPSTEVLDEASRVSVGTYAEDSGDGQVAEMFRYLAKSVREAPDLSTSEREYYDTFFTYLLAAWAGRVDSTKLPPPTPSRELESLFE